MAHQSDSSRKRIRLSFACNYCRSKKTRCDEEQPCRNCRQAGVDCITTDKRRAGAVVSSRRRTIVAATPASADSPSQQNSPPTSESHFSTSLPASSSAAVAAARSAGPVPGPSQSNDRPRLWSQCWGREGWQTGRLPLMPRFVGASTVEIMTEWLDMALYRLNGPKIHALSPVINDRFAAVIPDKRPLLPSPEEIQRCFQAYSNTVGQMFPFLDPDAIGSEFINEALDRSRHASDASQCALVYLTTAAGKMAMPVSDGTSSLVSSYVAYCNTLLGHIVAVRSLGAVQAILLFSMVLRSCDKIAWAWDILAMGISMAQSIGINQITHSTSTSLSSENRNYRTWWSMYVFEKILAFELGRPSMAWDRDLSSTLASTQSHDAMEDEDQLFWQTSLSLANMLHELQERSARTWRRETWLSQTVEQAIEDKLQTGGELIVLLSEWQRNLPDHLRLGSTSLPKTCNGARAAFLAYYYNLGVMLVHRSTLLVDPNELREVVERFASDKPWRQSLLSGPSMVTESAREMVRLFVPLVDSGTPNYLTLMTSPLAAVYALAVSIIREKRSLLVRSDFELMKAGMQISRHCYQKHSTITNLDDIMLDLESHLSQILEAPASTRLETTSLSSTNPILNDAILEESAQFPPNTFAWGPSSLDWVGWDWNDLSHLFQHSE
ncbi:Fungal Zn(2)-Cys(6) binuclear cluster domain-containing protein [Penicillium ucsense]|uniref:Fungal Zn(2)-Cys(6) binuclear cluster domain-containing protein n=1 Tax=Penicillium ucsense TaxID=2839758 RepID=A0A8J8WIV7_9EURO|nr:Fungal Zn(2)-Cys(6) binuclear cluster domain-containing protein [Penicillium ucsense]KAF7739595.1 Fungal Zn(2)-Cys(6) binuclear cluster domain-containing protein [Penicillium ucsense]